MPVFSPTERRSSTRSGKQPVRPSATGDTRARVAVRSGREIPLTPREVDLLEYLMSNQGRTVTREMLERAQAMGVETVFDRAATMKPCNIGMQGTCCKNCAMGPCRLPLPKGGIVGEDTRKGLCGATANTIARP